MRWASRRRCILWSLAAAFLGVSGCDRDSEAPAPALVEDVTELQRAITTDRVLGALQEVDEALDDDLPVRAAELLKVGALPAAGRHIERVEELNPQTPEGRRLQRQALELLRARRASLIQYQAVLERGLVEDIELLTAIREQREAEEAILKFLDELEVIRPVPVKTAPR